MKKELLTTALVGGDLDEPQLQELFAGVVAGELDDIQLAALLATLHTRGEKPTEVQAVAKALLDAAVAFPLPDYPVVDAAGTGGDGVGTINISTTGSIAVAAAGGAVLKHGNSAISSKSGSADLIRALGIPIPTSVAAAQAELNAKGFVFLLAPQFHPAMARFMPVRKSLGVPTVLNIIGPLLNPARPRLQMMGVGNARQLQLVAETMKMLGREHAIVMHGSGLDEIALHGPTEVYEIRGQEMEHYTITPADLGLAEYPLEELLGGTPAENAVITRNILAGKGTPAQQASVAANGGCLAYLLGLAPTLAQGTELINDLLAQGSGLDYLHTLADDAQAA